MIAEIKSKCITQGLLFTGYLVVFSGCNNQNAAGMSADRHIEVDSLITKDTIEVQPAALDTALYNQKLMQMVHGQPTEKWPVKTEYPLAGALLPFNRIIAFYGNLYSKG